MNIWLAGARPRTLGASVTPVLVGTALAAADGEVVAWRAAAALLVALGLQVGTNYANDYSDGLRGADADRLGPTRLVASALATPIAVRRAAVAAFAVAAVAGLSLALAVDLRLLAVGAVAMGAGVLYTGGPRPYGYAGLGEVAVLVFFGFVATCGSAYVHLERVPGPAVLASLAAGLPACALLLANNLRDERTDRRAGKRTLVVRLGRQWGRRVYAGSLAGALAAVVALAPARPGALLGLGAVPLALAPARVVLTRTEATDLAAALAGTARFQVGLGLLLAIGLWTF